MMRRAMPDSPTATDRARDLIHEYGLSEFASKAAIDALLYDPSLLADLAIEAGELEPRECLTCGGHAQRTSPGGLRYTCSACNGSGKDAVLLRRTNTEER
jgi:hypothetical protein